MHAITRAARRDGQPCWHVSLHRGGRRLQGRFADRAFGGEGQALAVAQAWRDAVLAAVPALDGAEGMDGVRRRTRSQGTPGLYRLPGRGTRAASWQARVVPPGQRPHTCSFSIARHGEDEARARAEAWLLARLRSMEEPGGRDGTLDGVPTLAPARTDGCAPGERAPAGLSLPPAGLLSPGGTIPPGGFHDEAFFGLFRVTNARGQARWHVHLSRAGRALQAPFPDLTYGGEAQALQVARAWRDAVLAVAPPLTHIALRQIVRRNRTEGMPGVYHDARRGTWKAVVSFADRRMLAHSFKVSVHGEAGARALAEAERLRMLDDLDHGRDPALRSPAARALAKRQG